VLPGVDLSVKQEGGEGKGGEEGEEAETEKSKGWFKRELNYVSAS